MNYPKMLKENDYLMAYAHFARNMNGCHDPSPLYLQYNKCNLHNAIFIMFPEGRAYSRRFVRPYVRLSAFSCPEYNFKTTRGMNMDLCG